MTNLPYAVWPEIVQHAEDLQTQQLTALFQTNPDRAHRYSIEAAGVYLDYSKNFFDDKTESLLIKLALESGVFQLAQKMFAGVALNNTEQRPALHTLLRAKTAPLGLEASFTEVCDTLDRVKRLSDAVRTGLWRGYSGKPIKQVLHLGIGGSYLGPKMVDEALASNRPAAADDFVCHYVANVDAHHLDEVLAQLDPAETLIIVVSKSFTTLETMTNAHSTRLWLLDAMAEADLKSHLIAVSSNVPAATDFGISEDNILPMWDWVGGRYSVWSAVGIPIAIRYGFDTFRQLLDGAGEMDQHFLHTEAQHNMPFVMAFLSVFYQHCFGSETHAVLTYDHRLRYLPDHLQQVDMESNGKNRDVEGNLLAYHSGAVIWGGEGTNGQHAFHQLLHQGTRTTGVDFIMTLRPDHQHQDHHDKLIASCLSQSQALMQGKQIEEISDAANELQRKHKVMPGNRPSNTLVLEHLDARHTGALVALYEHKVFCQAAIWHINPFDQWGVELGKALGDRILNEMNGNAEKTQSTEDDTKIAKKTKSLDGSTRALLDRYAASQKR